MVLDKDAGSAKCFGFVEMPKSGEANAVIKVISSLSNIRVKKAETKQGCGSDG